MKNQTSKDKFYSMFEKVTKTSLNEANIPVPNSDLNINDAGSKIIISLKNNQGIQIPVDKTELNSFIQNLQRFVSHGGNMRLSDIREGDQ
jgi:hypothetical protein